MAHFAKLDINEKSDATGLYVVLTVIVAEQDFIDSGVVGDPASWVQTSYNTYAGEHTKGGEPLRVNYAGVGHIYDRKRDAFIPPMPYPSWKLDEKTGQWVPPVPAPRDTLLIWSEIDQAWFDAFQTSDVKKDAILLADRGFRDIAINKSLEELAKPVAAEPISEKVVE